jgi:hypothetical protein
VTPAALETLRGLAWEGTLELRVAGSCMTPDLEDGATVRVGRARLYLPGDVVAFADRSGRLVLHRLIGYRSTGARLALWTWADAGAVPDAPVPLDRVIGRVTGKVSAWRRASSARRFFGLAASRCFRRP